MEPIRKPVHRPRPPHPHVQKRPHAALVRSQLLPEEPDPEETRQPQTVRPPRPSLVRTPPPPRPVTEPVTPPLAALSPPDEPRTRPEVPEERRARRLLLTALALHLAVLLAAWLAHPVADVEIEDLLLAGTILVSGGTMLIVGGAKRL